MAEGKGQENPTKESMGGGKGAATGARGPTPRLPSESTAKWGGLPGKPSPDRSAGTPKTGHFGGAKFDHAKSEGC
jgi:hypothetical protein